MTKKIIVLLGLPGSGKGTQGAILSELLGVPHISTGDILRKMAKVDKENEEDSRLLSEYMQAGKLIPSDLVNKIVRNFISLDECRNGCILDGYPRNLNQAEYFAKNIEKAIDSKVIAIFFDISDEIVIKRILGRYSCIKCNALYNRYFNQPKVDGICNICGSKEFSFRSDDDQKTVVTRIEEYKKETKPLVEYYKNKNSFFSINAGAAKEEVAKEVYLIAKKV